MSSSLEVDLKIPCEESGGTVRACWEPHARALLAYESGRLDSEILVVDDLGDTDRLPASWFFRDPESLPDLERRALELCRGSVLDLGAGAGCHALTLQARGHSVCAVEILPEVVGLLERRGVGDARAGSWLEPPAGQWDTILMLMNGWGLAETLSGLERFLQSLDGMVSPGGQVLADSTDMRRLASDWREDAGLRLALREDGRYVGEVQFQLEFEGRRGDPFSHLYVDPETLTALSARNGWTVDLVARGSHGAFLSRLTRSGEDVRADVPSGTRPTRGRGT